MEQKMMNFTEWNKKWKNLMSLKLKFLTTYNTNSIY